jgi:beta-galactosidase
MNWTDHRPGESVQVWAYSNADTVRLYLNGRSLGTRRFDHKTTTDGREYLETTEATHDDKTVTSGPYPGSYTSPGGSAGKLHLTWDVPYAPGTLKAVASRDGKVVATDVLRTAGSPYTVRLDPDRTAIAADGRSLSYVTADVVDRHGVTVPGAQDLLHFTVTGGTLAGLDNGREESAENYKASSRTAWGGKALAIVRSGHARGPITVTVTAPGLRPASTVIRGTGGTPGTDVTPVSPQPKAAAPVTADASYSGAPGTVPAAMLDGVTTEGGWSDYYNKAATALLPAFSLARPGDWVSVAWPDARTVTTVTPYFTIGAGRALPATAQVVYLRDGHYVPVRNAKITWAAATNQPTTITFDPVRTTSVRLEMTSRAPGTPGGFLQIAELRTG